MTSSPSKSLSGVKIAVLVAGGFCEQDLTEMQRAMQKTGANMRVVSMDQGLVNSWNGTGWGLNFAPDALLNAALAADYDMLIIPGGQRSAEKLKLTAHTKRFIGGFTDTGKPVVAFDEALELLCYVQKIDGRMVTGPEKIRDMAVSAGAKWSDDVMVTDGMMMTGGAARGPRDAYVKAACDFLMAAHNANADMSKAA